MLASRRNNHRVTTGLVLDNRAGGIGIGTPHTMGIGWGLDHHVAFKAADDAFDLIGRAHCLLRDVATMRAGQRGCFGHNNQTSWSISGWLTVTINIGIRTKDTTLTGLCTDKPRTLRAHPAHHSGAVRKWSWVRRMTVWAGNCWHVDLMRLQERRCDCAPACVELARFLTHVLFEFLGKNPLLLHAIAVAHSDGAVLE